MALVGFTAQQCVRRPWSTSWRVSGWDDLGDYQQSGALSIMIDETDAQPGGSTQATIISDGSALTVNGSALPGWVSTVGARNLVCLVLVGNTLHATANGATLARVLGLAGIAGAGSVVLGQITSIAAGTVLSGLVGTASATLGAVTSTAVGTVATAPTKAADTFDRADSATTLGISSGGQAWTTTGTAVWGITGGLAYEVTQPYNGEAVAVIQNDSANMDVSIKLTAPTTGRIDGSGLAYRYLDSNNFWMVFPATDGWAVYKKVGGAYTLVLSTHAGAITAGAVYTIRAVASGNNHSWYINGVQIGTTTTDASVNTGTGVGMRMDTSNTVSNHRWDDLVVS